MFNSTTHNEYNVFYIKKIKLKIVIIYMEFSFYITAIVDNITITREYIEHTNALLTARLNIFRCDILSYYKY